MFYKANQLTRYQQSKLNKPLRGYYTQGAFDYFSIYTQRYSSSVVTLKTALSIHGIIDSWVEPPFDLDFKLGYRKIADSKVNQFRDNEKLLNLGIDTKKEKRSSFKIYNKERLLIELWRKEKYLSFDIYKEAINKYRELAKTGELNIPLVKQYITQIPKSHIYLERLSREIL